LQLQFFPDSLGEYITIYSLTVIAPTPKGMGEGGFTSKGNGMMEGGEERGDGKDGDDGNFPEVKISRINTVCPHIIWLSQLQRCSP